MDLIVRSDGTALWGSRSFRCALGSGGLVRDKREGDGGTPIGAWPMRRLLWRPDRLPRPETHLAIREIRPRDGWCDAPDDAAYNQPVRLPYRASAEHLRRRDRVYDLVVPLGYNDDPPVAGRGSAIFLHLARPTYAPTQGCVALALPDMLEVLRDASPDSRVIIG